MIDTPASKAIIVDGMNALRTWGQVCGAGWLICYNVTAPPPPFNTDYYGTSVRTLKRFLLRMRDDRRKRAEVAQT